MSMKVILQQALKSRDEAAGTQLGGSPARKLHSRLSNIPTCQVISTIAPQSSQHLKGLETEMLSSFSLPQALLFQVNRAKGKWLTRHCSQGKMTAGGENRMREAER